MLKAITETMFDPLLALLLKFDSCPSNSIGVAYKHMDQKKIIEYTVTVFASRQSLRFHTTTLDSFSYFCHPLFFGV